MRILPVLLSLFVTTLAGCMAPSADDPSAPSPYVDQRFSEVRGLSVDEIEDLRTGAGMGFARPAELNGYPGPLHVLELADELGLDDAQRAEVQAIRAAMLEAAVPLGEEVLEAYAALESAFRARDIDADSLRLRLDRLEALYEELRFVHLVAHLDTAPVLSEDQTVRYMELRGYHDGSDGAGHAPSEDGGHEGHTGHAD